MHMLLSPNEPSAPTPAPASAADEAADRELIEAELARAERPCVTTSFQAGGVVLLHLLQDIRRDIPVLFLDTFHHFPETLRYRDEMVERLGLNLTTLQAPEPQPGLWKTSLDACCQRHKVDPLFGALEQYDLWFSALRRGQSPTRAHLADAEDFGLPGGRRIRKVSPLASWTSRDVWAYARRHGIPLLPLYEQGYTSIGCAPCTARPADPSNERSGRWQGQKLECGIHVGVSAFAG
jgi:phosphoadenosine phosphosulfate reductase